MHIYKAFVLISICSTIFASQTIDIEEQTICNDENKCEQVDSIFIPNKLDKCSEDLFFQYGADSFAYLTHDGKINSKTKETECDLSFKRVKYALKNLIVEVIKHKNSVYVKKSENINDFNSEKPLSGITKFIHDKVHDFVQYILVSVLIVIKVSGYIFRPFSRFFFRR
jgi:hypothetical protein